MAWLDDSPMVLADDREFVYSASNHGRLHTNHGKLISALKILQKWYQTLSLSRKLSRKLTAIEARIKATHFDEVGSITSLLRELLQTKKISRNLLLERVAKSIGARSDQLKAYLIHKSHLNFEHGSSPKPVITPPVTGNSHQRLVNLFNQKTAEVIPLSKNVPERVYWRYPQPEFATSYANTALKPRKSQIYLQTSCQKLLVLLSNKINANLLNKIDDIKVCDKGFNATAQSDCGISLRLSHQPTFWQQSASLLKNILHKFNDQHLTSHIHEIFFQTTSHYQQFKNLLHISDNRELIELVAMLEAKQQVVITEDQPGLGYCP